MPGSIQRWGRGRSGGRERGNGEENSVERRGDGRVSLVGHGGAGGKRVKESCVFHYIHWGNSVSASPPHTVTRHAVTRAGLEGPLRGVKHVVSPEMVVHALQLDVPGYPHGPRGAPRAGHVQLAVLHFPHRVHSGLLREKAQMVVRIVDLGVEPAVGNGREEGVGYGIEVAWARAGGENGGVGGTREIRAGGVRGEGYVWLVLAG